MKAKFLSIVFALSALFAFNNAFAQNPHLQGPLYATDQGLFLEVCFDIAGLGNVREIPLVVTYDAYVESDCENPAGNIAPGQSRTFTRQSQTFNVEVRNGRARGCRTTTQTFPAGSGPNPKWSCYVTDVTYSNVSVSIGGRTFPVTDLR